MTCVGAGCLGSCRRDRWCLLETFPARSSGSECLWVTSSQRRVRRMWARRVVSGREAMALVDARFDYQMRRVLAQPCAMRISVPARLHRSVGGNEETWRRGVSTRIALSLFRIPARRRHGVLHSQTTCMIDWKYVYTTEDQLVQM